MSAAVITFPCLEPSVASAEWRIEVNSREDEGVTCTYIPADPQRTAKEAHWLLWVHAATLAAVPALVEKGQQLLKYEQAIKRPGGKRFCERPPPLFAGSPTPIFA